MYTDMSKLSLFNSMLKEYKETQSIPIYFELEISKINKKIIARHQQLFPWHQAALLKSMTDPRKEPPSYLYRLTEMFGVDQIKVNKTHMNNLMCTWNPKTDITNSNKPSLILLKFLKDGKHLNLSVVFRHRDLIKRLPGNWYVLTKFLNDKAKCLKLKPGKLFDYSMAASFHIEDYIKWID